MGDRIQITTADGTFDAYRSLPGATPAPVVVVLQELFGVNADIRQTCDELAARGFMAISPDLFWRQQPGVDLDVRSPDDWKTGLALYEAFDRDLGVQDVIATVRAARTLQGSSGKVGLLGYCMGALMAFVTAARSEVDATVAFHGADTDKYLGEAASLRSPLLMHLAGEDEFMPEPARNAIITAMESKPDAQVFTYAGCHHAFTRHNGAHYHAQAAALANERTWSFLHANLD